MFFFFIYFSKKISNDISCELSVNLFSLKQLVPGLQSKYGSISSELCNINRVNYLEAYFSLVFIINFINIYPNFACRLNAISKNNIFLILIYYCSIDFRGSRQTRKHLLKHVFVINEQCCVNTLLGVLLLNMLSKHFSRHFEIFCSFFPENRL